MNNRCPYCDSEMDYLEVVRDEITWDGETWHHDSLAISNIRCPYCGTDFEAVDFGTLGCGKAVNEIRG